MTQKKRERSRQRRPSFPTPSVSQVCSDVRCHSHRLGIAAAAAAATHSLTAAQWESIQKKKKRKDTGAAASRALPAS